MKIERAESKFEPIVITLESQGEVDQMYAIVSNISFNGHNDITSDLYTYLSERWEASYTLEDTNFSKD